MTDLLSKSEYQKVARELTLPAFAVIDRKLCGAASGETFATINPATGERLADIPACSQEDGTLRSRVRAPRSMTAAGRSCIPPPASRPFSN